MHQTRSVLILLEFFLTTHRSRENVGQATTAERLVRGWRRVDRTVLRRILEDSPLCQPVPEDAEVDDLFATYDDVLRRAADSLAPKHPLRRPASRLAPWFDDDCCHARRHCRRLERQYRRTNSADDRRLWVDAVRGRLDFGCIGPRRKHTGWIVCRKTGAHRRWCGVTEDDAGS